MSRFDFSNALAGIPDYSAFPTVDALTDRSAAVVRANPGSVAIQRLGTSRLGEPIHALVVGHGERAALVFGGVHPNEPIGGLSATYLAELLARDAGLREKWDLTWYIVPCIDPDGTRLNEGWFGGPFTRSHYGRNFYRPAADEQVEWTFPLHYKNAYFDRVLPETLALMRLIDRVRPALMVSLHNGESGGVYYYLSHERPDLYAALKALPKAFGLPLDRGEPEAPYARRFDDGIYASLSSTDAYDYRERTTATPWVSESGDSSASYASQYGTFTLVSEVPYWIDGRSQSATYTSMAYSECLRQHAEALAELAAELDYVLAALPPGRAIDSPFLRASRRFVPSFFERAQAERLRADSDASNRPATVAEAYSLEDNIHSFRMRYGGMMLRAARVQREAGGDSVSLRRCCGHLESIFEVWSAAADAATPSEAVPIRSLVAVQVGAMLEAASQLARVA